MSKLSEMGKIEFVYECSLRALQGSFANPAAKATAASIVREAEKLWEELKEWEAMNAKAPGDIEH